MRDEQPSSVKRQQPPEITRGALAPMPWLGRVIPTSDVALSLYCVNWSLSSIDRVLLNHFLPHLFCTRVSKLFEIQWAC